MIPIAASFIIVLKKGETSAIAFLAHYLQSPSRGEAKLPRRGLRGSGPGSTATAGCGASAFLADEVLRRRPELTLSLHRAQKARVQRSAASQRKGKRWTPLCNESTSWEGVWRVGK